MLCEMDVACPEVEFIRKQIDKVRVAIHNHPKSNFADLEFQKKRCLDSLDTLDNLLCVPANVEILRLLLNKYYSLL